jgi:flavodoxin
VIPLKKAIVYFSYSGHTEAVAKTLYEQMIQKEAAVLIKLEALNPKDNPTLLHAPDIKAYDEIILGTPVRGFQLPPIMVEFIKTIDNSDIPLSLFVTHHFKPDFLGGNQTINQFKKLAKTHQIKETEIISWRAKNKDARIASLLSKFN